MLRNMRTLNTIIVTLPYENNLFDRVRHVYLMSPCGTTARRYGMLSAARMADLKFIRRGVHPL